MSVVCFRVNKQWRVDKKWFYNFVIAIDWFRFFQPCMFWQGNGFSSILRFSGDEKEEKNLKCVITGRGSHPLRNHFDILPIQPQIWMTLVTTYWDKWCCVPPSQLMAWRGKHLQIFLSCEDFFSWKWLQTLRLVDCQLEDTDPFFSGKIPK